MIQSVREIRLQITFILLFFVPLISVSQNLKGIVIDIKSAVPLCYVHIGVAGKNVGTITNDKGEFSIDLSKIEKTDKIQFSIIGYHSIELISPDHSSGKITIKMNPISYEIPAVIVESKKVENIKIGRYKASKTTTGQSGIKEFGFGGELGIRINYPGHTYYLKDINFHTHFNTVDSALFRLNVYEIENGLPGSSKLQKEVYTKSYAKDKWISTHVLSHGLKIDADIIVTFELIRIWYSKDGSNFLFYTHGKGYAEGQVFSRESSFDKWSINKREPIAMFVTGLRDK